MSEHGESRSTNTGRRWLLWGVLAPSLLVIAGGLIFWLAMPGPIERAYKQIKPGMTLREVEDLFGQTASQSVAVRGAMNCAWIGEDGTVVVQFDAAHGVYRATFLRGDDQSYRQGVRRQIRSWLGLGGSQEVLELD
jgi:hypothetical protein